MDFFIYKKIAKYLVRDLNKLKKENDDLKDQLDSITGKIVGYQGVCSTHRQYVYIESWNREIDFSKINLNINNHSVDRIKPVNLMSSSKEKLIANKDKILFSFFCSSWDFPSNDEHWINH